MGGPAGTASHGHAGDPEQARRELGAHLRALPPEDFPRIAEAAEPHSRCGEPDTDVAVALLLAGIQALARGNRTG